MPYPEGLDTIAKAVGEVDPSIGEFVRMMDKQRWVEGSEGDAKRPGAYCTMFAKTRSPRVYLSAYNGSLAVRAPCSRRPPSRRVAGHRTVALLFRIPFLAEPFLAHPPSKLLSAARLHAGARAGTRLPQLGHEGHGSGGVVVPDEPGGDRLNRACQRSRMHEGFGERTSCCDISWWRRLVSDARSSDSPCLARSSSRRHVASRLPSRSLASLVLICPRSHWRASLASAPPSRSLRRSLATRSPPRRSPSRSRLNSDGTTLCVTSCGHLPPPRAVRVGAQAPL